MWETKAAEASWDLIFRGIRLFGGGFGGDSGGGHGIVGVQKFHPHDGTIGFILGPNDAGASRWGIFAIRVISFDGENLSQVDASFDDDPDSSAADIQGPAIVLGVTGMQDQSCGDFTTCASCCSSLRENALDAGGRGQTSTVHDELLARGTLGCCERASRGSRYALTKIIVSHALLEASRIRQKMTLDVGTWVCNSAFGAFSVQRAVIMGELTLSDIKQLLIAHGMIVYRMTGNSVAIAERVRDNLIMEAHVQVVVESGMRVRFTTRAQRADFPSSSETEPTLLARARELGKPALSLGFSEICTTVESISDPMDASCSLDTWYQVHFEKLVNTDEELICAVQQAMVVKKVAPR